MLLFFIWFLVTEFNFNIRIFCLFVYIFVRYICWWYLFLKNIWAYQLLTHFLRTVFIYVEFTVDTIVFSIFWAPWKCHLTGVQPPWFLFWIQFWILPRVPVHYDLFYLLFSSFSVFEQLEFFFFFFFPAMLSWDKNLGFPILFLEM